MNKCKQNKRTKILDAALYLIAENGFHGCPAWLIAQKAGVGAGTIYRYFENKDGIIEELYRQVRQDMEAAVFAKNSNDLPVQERFIRMFKKLTKYLASHPHKFKFFEQYYNSPYGIKKKRKQISSEQNFFDVFFNYGKKLNLIKVLDNSILFAIGFGPITYLVQDHINGFICLNDVLIKQTIGACWDGLKK